MAYWLIKTEPSTWSWANQVAAGNKGTAWEGVRNFQAMRNLKQMKKGELAFFYHTGDEKQIVGIVDQLFVILCRHTLESQGGAFRFGSSSPIIFDGIVNNQNKGRQQRQEN